MLTSRSTAGDPGPEAHRPPAGAPRSWSGAAGPSRRPPRRARVTAIVANVKQYRVEFFRRLRDALAPRGVEFNVLFSAGNPVETSKQDHAPLEAPLGREIPALHALGHRLLLQWPSPADLRDADLVILPQASGTALTYPLLLSARLGRRKLALWGHGYNHQGDPGALTERLKRRLAPQASWWFAYTDDVARYLRSIGVDAQRITVVENSVDTVGFARAVAALSPPALAAARRRFQLGDEGPIGLTCGALYREKQVAFLIDAAREIARLVPGFRLLVVGAGPDAHLVEAAMRAGAPLRWVGPQFGPEKALAFGLADVVLNPGLVGLGLLDAFAAGVPLVTTRTARHSPEIAYLRHGQNGLISDGSVAAFAAEVIGVLANPEHAATLRRGALASAQRYTLENMVQRFGDGILACLGRAEEVGP